MGEMIKFGIKLGLCIATAVALCAALFALFSLIPSFSNSSSFLADIFWIFSLAAPVNFRLLFGILGPLFSFRVAYWIADKTIVFIDSIG